MARITERERAESPNWHSPTGNDAELKLLAAKVLDNEMRRIRHATGMYLEGQQFGRLKVLDRARKSSRGRLWRCRCECGAETFVTSADLRSEHVRSCGCLKRAHMRELGEARRKHGAVQNNRATAEYRAWQAMLNRCRRAKNANYRYYGGRGITVADRWQSFEAFLADMGSRPSPRHSLDRINPDGNYEPGNCRWATASEQQRNKSRRAAA